MSPSATIERVLKRLDYIRDRTQQMDVAGEVELAKRELLALLAKLD